MRGRILAASVVLCGASCGGAMSTRTTASHAPPAAPGPAVVASSSCGGTVTASGSHLTEQCVFVLSDGRRFRCSGSGVARAMSSESSLEHSRACTRLPRLEQPASSRAVAAAIEAARACLAARGLHPVGGAIAPTENGGQGSADGELTVGGGAGGAFVAFYTDPQKAQRLAPAVIARARAVGGQVERHGAVIVIWIRQLPRALRRSVEACVFR